MTNMPRTGAQKTASSVTNVTRIMLLKELMGAGKMAQYTRALAAKSDDLSSIPGTHVVEGENQIPQICSLSSTPRQ